MWCSMECPASNMTGTSDYNVIKMTLHSPGVNEHCCPFQVNANCSNPLSYRDEENAMALYYVPEATVICTNKHAPWHSGCNWGDYFAEFVVIHYRYPRSLRFSWVRQAN